MRENIEVMAGMAAALGALLKGLKKKFTNKELIINMIVAGFISFGVVAAVTYWLPEHIEDPKVLLFVTFFAGWITNDFTNNLEESMSDVYDIFLDWLRNITKTNTKPKDEK